MIIFGVVLISVIALFVFHTVIARAADSWVWRTKDILAFTASQKEADRIKASRPWYVRYASVLPSWATPFRYSL